MDVVFKKVTYVCGLSLAGVLLAVLETLEIIAPIYGPNGIPSTNAGTVSAGYQNFLVRYGSLIGRCSILSAVIGIMNLKCSPLGLH